MTTTVSPEHREILQQLEKLGGRLARHDDITCEGTRFVIPEGMTPQAAKDFLEEWITNQEELHEFTRVYPYRPYDGAAACYDVLNDLYGGVMGKTVYTMFGVERPQFVDVPVSFGQTRQVPWGNVQFPLVNGMLTIGATRDAEHGTIFAVTVECPKKYKWAVEGFFASVAVHLANNSIYRGQAFDGRPTPNFIDLRGVDPSKIIYTDEVTQQLETNVWGLLRYTQQMRDYGIPMKRTVLLEGPYGAGKTLAAYLTAKEAVSKGWTFIYCRPGTDDLHAVLQTARLYQPAVVFAEDIDTKAVAEGAEALDVSRFLDTFDGITSKNVEVVAILTTNHLDKIHKAMLRPGRLDAVIHIAELDRRGVEALVRSAVPSDSLGEVDFDEIAEAMKGYLPAFIKEAVDRASRYAFVRGGGKPDKINTIDLVGAARGLRDQLRVMEAAPEHDGLFTLDRALKTVVEDVVSRTAPGQGSYTFVVADEPNVPRER